MPANGIIAQSQSRASGLADNVVNERNAKCSGTNGVGSAADQYIVILEV